MKRCLFSILLLAFMVIPLVSFGANSCETITVADTAIGFPALSIKHGSFEAKEVFCVLDTAQIRFWYSGATPTTTVGMPLEDGQTLILNDHNDIVKFLAVRTTGTSGTLSCCFK
jgi:hypothetical protein